LSASDESWEGVAKELDAFYKKEKDALWRAIDKVFRSNVTERIDLTLLECKSVNGKSILDIGCGLGLLAAELKRKGALITSLKLSIANIDMTIRDEFIYNDIEEDFDISLALGVFDYIKDPSPFLRKMHSVTREKCIMSFASAFAFQVPLRIIWLRSKKCPVYFYTKEGIKRLVSPIFSRYKIKNISAGYHCVAFV